MAARFSASIGAVVLVLDYRLAPEHPFPAAVDDTISAFRWLVKEGYSQSRIVIGGDSAGGGLTLQALLAMREEGVSLPAAAFFLSPLTDFVRFDGETYVSRAGIDPLLTEEICRFTASQYVGDSDPESPLLSPVSADLSDLPPLCIHVGDRDLLLSDSIRLAERARAFGVVVELKVWPGLWHVFQASARFVPEASRSLDEIGRFVKDHAGF
jgi:acetyl esterase/lipase